jgi:hypothetical protein
MIRFCDSRPRHWRSRNTIARLIRAVIEQGKGASSIQQFCKRNNRWIEGLISAIRPVAFATNLNIETADSVLSGTHSYERLIVASNQVAGPTAQLVAVSGVTCQSRPISCPNSRTARSRCEGCNRGGKSGTHETHDVRSQRSRSRGRTCRWTCRCLSSRSAR